jgi:nucleoside-diphosphate-sugar epimerase
MRVFVTGATGYIGSALVRALMAAGHEAVGLVRKKATPARAVVGDLGQPASYESAAHECDAIVHTGFDYQSKSIETDKLAIETLLRAARGTFIYTSGIWVLGPTTTAVDETSRVAPAPLVAWRPAHEQLVLDSFSGKVPTAVLRPGIVIGGRGGLVDGFFEGKEHVGPGENRWNTIHRDDLADLYLRILETPLARHDLRVFHATDGTHDRVAEIARALASASGRPAPRAWPLEEARKKLGPYADALAMDQVIASTHSEKRLGWRPRIRGAVRNARLLLDERARHS